MAANDVDDLDVNPYFKLLQNKYKKKFVAAQDKCLFICIPKAETIENVNITSEFVDIHMLKKSPLFKGVYLTSGNTSKTLEIAKETIITLTGFGEQKKISILSREYGYNKKSQQFQILIIDEPLIPVQRIVRKPNKNDIIAQKLKLAVRDLNFTKCAEFLHEGLDHEEIVFNLDKLLQQFNSNYIVLPKFLLSTAKKLKEIIDDTVHDLSLVYELVIEHNHKVKSCFNSIVECYVMRTVHNKVFPVVCQEMSTQDKTLSDKLLTLNSMNITADQLGIKEVFCIPQAAAVVELASLDSYCTPVEKLNCLRNTIRIMTETVQQYLKDNKQVILLQMMQLPTLTTEDIIPILVTVIIQSKLTHLASNLYYVMNFHWPDSVMDKSSFDLVTFEAAVEYIKRTNFEGLKPPKTQIKKELTLEELMEVTGKVTARERNKSNADVMATKPSTGTITPMGIDRELEKITKMIEASTRELQTVQMMGITKSSPQRQNTNKGEFFSQIQDNLGVCFGKQT